MRAPGDIHAEWIHPQGAVCLVADLVPTWIEQMCEPSEVVRESSDFRGGLLKNLAWRLYDEFNKRDETAREWIEQLMQGVMAEAARRHAQLIERHPPGWLVQVKEALHAQFASPLCVPLAESLTPSVMAASVGVHPVHLARAFRQWYHCTPSDYIHHLRMDFAQRAMLESDAPLVDIALAAGFYDQSHFSRSFKRHTGLTPTQYRLVNRPR
jgi:AraC family transcriptional regulator